MTTKLLNALQSNIINANNVRIALFILMVVLFVLGAGAPSDGGGLGGFSTFFFGPGF